MLRNVSENFIRIDIILQFNLIDKNLLFKILCCHLWKDEGGEKKEAKKKQSTCGVNDAWNFYNEFYTVILKKLTILIRNKFHPLVIIYLINNISNLH